MMRNIFKGTLYKGGLISKSLSLWLKSSKKWCQLMTPEHYFLWMHDLTPFLKI